MKWRRRMGLALFVVSAIKLVGCAYIIFGKFSMTDCAQVQHLTGIVGILSALVWLIAGAMLAKR